MGVFSLILDKIFTDETSSLQIDFSNAVFATDKLNNIFHDAGMSILKDVDFVAETDTEFIFVECKNSNRVDAENSEAFNPKSDRYINSVAQKYYDSLSFLNFTDKNLQKKKIFCYIIESKGGDIILRNYLRTRIANLLPFKLQRQEFLPCTIMIDDFFVFSFNEWNKNFPQFPLSRLVEPFCQN